MQTYSMFKKHIKICGCKSCKQGLRATEIMRTLVRKERRASKVQLIKLQGEYEVLPFAGGYTD